MKLKSLGIWSALALLVATAACEKSSPAKPSDSGSTAQAAASSSATSVALTAEGKAGITITAPQAVTPANNQQFKNVEQPITLTVKNAVSTGSTALTYTFEVATDAAFANKVYAKDSVAEGSGQTSLKIDPIGADKSYFWRARAAGGANSAVRGFTIGPAVTLQAPVLVSPAANGAASGTVLLIANNVGRAGPAGPIFYRFDLSSSAAFSNILFTNTVAEQSGGRTSVAVSANMANGTYFWRVVATDPASAVTSPTSAVFSFTYQTFTLASATILNSPSDLATWAETAKITSVQFTGDAMLVDFDKRDGPDRWPDTPFGDGGSLEYTLGMCLNISDHWYCSAVVQFWNGRELTASGQPGDIGRLWFYDAARWGPMTGHQPAEGETIGFFVCAGNCRNNTAGDNSYVKERSNVALVPFTYGGANYSFAGNRTLSIKR